MAFSDVVGAFLAAGFLYVFYRVIESEWPESYHSVDDLTRYLPSTSPARYLLFRFGPPLIACFVMGGITFREGRSGLASAILVAVLHTLHTVGRAIVRGRLWRDPRKPYFWTHILVGFGIMLSALLAGAIASVPSTWQLVPDFQSASSDLWAALLAGLIGAFFVKTTRRQLDLAEIVGAAQRRLGDQLIVFARETAAKSAADPTLVEAIMIAESLQRPRWFRRLEHRFGLLLGARSYGVMQVPNSAPMTDEESIELAVHGYLRGPRIGSDQYGYPDYEAIKAAAMGYNPSSEYAELVAAIYMHIWGDRH